VACISDVSV